MISLPTLSTGASGLLGLSTCFPARYSVKQYTAQDGARYGVQRFVALRKYPRCSSITHHHHARDTATGAWPQRWKHWGRRGVLEFRTVGLEMKIPLVHFAEKISYQRPLAALLATWRLGKSVPTVPDVAFSFLDEDWSPLWFVVKSLYWEHEFYFETWLSISDSLLIRRPNVVIFAVLPAHQYGLSLLFSTSRAKYKYPYLIRVLSPLLFMYYSGLFLRGTADYIRRIIILVISQFAILINV